MSKWSENGNVPAPRRPPKCPKSGPWHMWNVWKTYLWEIIKIKSSHDMFWSRNTIVYCCGFPGDIPVLKLANVTNELLYLFGKDYSLQIMKNKLSHGVCWSTNANFPCYRFRGDIPDVTKVVHGTWELFESLIYEKSWRLSRHNVFVNK